MNKQIKLKRKLLNILEFTFYFFRNNKNIIKNLDKEKIFDSTKNSINNNLIKYKILKTNKKILIFDIFYSFLMNHYLINSNKRLSITFLYFSLLFFYNKEMIFEKNYVKKFRNFTKLLQNNNKTNKKLYFKYLFKNLKQTKEKINISINFKKLNQKIIKRKNFKILKKIILELQNT